MLASNERIGILPWQVNKLFSLPWKEHGDKLVVRQPVTFQDKLRFRLHRLLRAIDLNTLGTTLPVEAQADERETFAFQEALLTAFKGHSFIITNIYKLMEACSVDIDCSTDKTKQCYGATKEDDRVLLSKLAHDGFLRRYDKNNKVSRERLDKELKIIFFQCVSINRTTLDPCTSF